MTERKYCPHHYTGGACVMCGHNPWSHKNPNKLVNAGYEQAAINDYWWMKELCSWDAETVADEGYHSIHVMKAFHNCDEEIS